MLKSACGLLPANLQYIQLRLGHRIRGKAPIYCRTIQERIDELNKKDEIYTAKIDIGLPLKRKTIPEVQKERWAIIKKLKADKNFEKQAREYQIRANLDDVKMDWEQTVGPFHKKKIAEHYSIYEHLYGEGFFMPLINLEILYDLKDGSFLPVYYGNVIKPSEALDVPSVAYTADENSLYTLALTSLDGHLTENDKEYVHWLVANIPGDAVQKGDTLVDYLRPFPLKGTGYHRYVFVLYQQNGRVAYDVPRVTAAALDKRTFITREWYSKYQDNITPVGLAFYQSDWDVSVRDFFHKVLDVKEPVYEYDFNPPYIKRAEWFPHRNPFNLYMDKYRDPKQINKEYLIRKLKNEDPFKPSPPPLKYPNAHPFPRGMPSWLKLHEKKIRLGWGRVNDV